MQEMVLQAQKGDAAAYYAVCCQFRGLVMKHARQGHLAAMREDAESEGWLALAQAVKDFDLSRGVPFAGYAERCVTYRLWNVFKKERRRWQTELPLESERTDDSGSEGLELLERIEASDDVAGEAERREQREVLRQALLDLPARQRQAVTATCIGEGRLLDLALAWGVSVQAVHATRKKALLSVKERLRTLL